MQWLELETPREEGQDPLGRGTLGLNALPLLGISAGASLKVQSVGSALHP